MEDRDEVYDYLCRILRREAADRSGKIHGAGHAVYTLSDPGAVCLSQLAETLAREEGREDEHDLFKLVAELAPAVFEEVKGSKKKVSANVDFLSGSRVAGWCAHRLEQLVQNRLIRPAYRDLVERRPCLPLAQRNA